MERSNGLSYKIDDKGKLTEITFPLAEGEDKPAKYSNIKYDEDGKLKEYQVASGHKFTRQSSEDENGFAKWNCTWTAPNGRVYNTDYSGAGDNTYNANVKIDKNGASIMIGEPLTEANKEFSGNLYYRSANADRTNSTPIRDESGKTIGISTKMKVDGVATSLDSNFNKNGVLEPDLRPMATKAIGKIYDGVTNLSQDGGMLDKADNLAKQESLTREQLEKKEKVEKLKDKIESLEDPILELTNAFKKFEQIGGLQISQDRDGSYKADIQYRGPNRLPSQFNGPVTYKKGRPVWSTGMALNPNISFNFRPTNDGVMVDRMSGVFSSASWKGIAASGPQNWMQLGKDRNDTPYMKANTTSTGSKRVLFWNISRTENNTNTFTASDFKPNTGMRTMLSDSSAIDGLNGALKLFQNADVTNLSMNRPNSSKPKDFDVDVRFRDAKELKLDEKLEGPLELDSITLAKDLKFKIRQGADGADQDRNPDSVEIDASGITANIQIGKSESRLLKLQPKKVTIAKDDDGNAVLQMHIESDQIKKLQSADFEVDLKDLDKIKSGKVTLVNVPLLKALSSAAVKELTRAAQGK